MAWVVFLVERRPRTLREAARMLREGRGLTGHAFVVEGDGRVVPPCCWDGELPGSVLLARSVEEAVEAVARGRVRVLGRWADGGEVYTLAVPLAGEEEARAALPGARKGGRRSA